MSLGRFISQPDLKKIYAYYTEAYKRISLAPTGYYPPFNDMRILRAKDGSGVYFDAGTALLGYDNLEKDAILGKQIAAHIIDVAAYFLAQGMPPEDVSADLNICQAVCHNHVHWTGVMATVKSFRDFYASLYRKCFDEINYASHADEMLLFNAVKNKIYQKLGVVLSKDADATPEIDKAMIIFDAIGKKNIEIDHYDSMNSDAYARRIDHSLQVFTEEDKLIEANHLLCSQQRGNTCGDHTVLNLFMAAMLKEQPVINGVGAHSRTSSDLRQLTDQIAPAKSHKEELRVDLDKVAQREAKDEFEEVLQETLIAEACELISNSGKVVLPDSLPISEGEATIQIDESVNDLISQLHETCPSLFLQLYTAATSNDLDEIRYIRDLYKDNSVNKGCAIAETLAATFNGELNNKTDEIFSGITEPDRIVYGNLAKIIAEEVVDAVQVAELKNPPKAEQPIEIPKDLQNMFQGLFKTAREIHASAATLKTQLAVIRDINGQIKSLKRGPDGMPL